MIHGLLLAAALFTRRGASNRHGFANKSIYSALLLTTAAKVRLDGIYSRSLADFLVAPAAAARDFVECTHQLTFVHVFVNLTVALLVLQEASNLTKKLLIAAGTTTLLLFVLRGVINDVLQIQTVSLVLLLRGTILALALQELLAHIHEILHGAGFGIKS